MCKESPVQMTKYKRAQALAKMKMMRLVFLLIVFVTLGCSPTDPQMETSKGEVSAIGPSWSISREHVLGPYSPFPLVTHSSFVGTDDVTYSENHLTALISLGPNELRAYPNAFIGLYEVINNEFEDKKYAVTHCPLTGSTICWDRVLGNELLTVKASGYLYHDNIMPTDIETGTIWSQMLMRGVSGKYDRASHGTYNVVETDWETVKKYFPEAKVYNEIVEGSEAGIDVETETTNRDFYRYGILSGVDKITVHIYNYNLFDQEGRLTLKTTLVSGKNILVVGNKDLNFISSYFIDGTSRYSVGPSNTLHFQDDRGNTYNAMGLAIAGPDKDLQLKSPKAYTAAWVAWQDFFENFVIYE